MQATRDLKCTLILDEFYSHYLWDEALASGTTVSAAEYVDDVNVDPVVILDGLTVEHEPEGGFYAWASVTIAVERIKSMLARAGA